MSDRLHYDLLYPKSFMINNTGFSAIDDAEALAKSMDDLRRFHLRHGLLYRLNGTRNPDLVCTINCSRLIEPYVGVDIDTGKVIFFHQF